jgi:hypothetical protein
VSDQLTSTGAGWRPDPDRPGGLRYHDGRQWTEHRSDPAAKPPASAVPVTRQRYEYNAEVNKKSINMGRLTQIANGRGAEGWRLAHAFEQDGNTLLIWERPIL